MFVIAVFIQTVCALVPAAEVKVAVLVAETVMLALAVRSAPGTLSTTAFTLPAPLPVAV